MKRGDKEIFDEAVTYERSKKWHLTFAEKIPQTGKKFKCTTLFTRYGILAKTKLPPNKLIQILEPGLYLISNPLISYNLCINIKEYMHNWIYVGFVDAIPQEDISHVAYVITIKDGKIRETPIITDNILVCKRLDLDLYYITTIDGKAYYLFLRPNI